MPSVLIVEDNMDTLDLMDAMLSSQGYDTMRASNGLEALEQMRHRRPCLVLLDLMMPVMNGWEFRRRQSQDPALCSVPVVAVTAVADIRGVQEELGVRCFRKTGSFDPILAEVRSACGKGQGQ